MLSLREIPPILYLTPHGRDAHPPIRSKADPSGLDPFVLQKLREAYEYAMSKGVLPEWPEKDINPFIWFLRTFDHYDPQTDYLWYYVGEEKFNRIARYMQTGLMKGPYSSMDRAIGTVSRYLNGFEGDISTPLTLNEAWEMRGKRIVNVSSPDEIYAELERIRKEGSQGVFCEFILAPGKYEFKAPVLLPPNVKYIFNGSPDTKLYFPPGVKSGFMLEEGQTVDYTLYLAHMFVSSTSDFTLINNHISQPKITMNYARTINRI